jgi:hypothetical protein
VILEDVEAEQVVAEPTIHMLEAATLSAAWKVIVEPFRSILHILDETLQQIATDRIVDVMLQTQRATCSRISVSPIRVDWTSPIPID